MGLITFFLEMTAGFIFRKDRPGKQANFWEALAASGSLWEPLGSFWSLRELLGASGLWEFLRASGSLWELLGSLELLGATGSLVGALGACGSLWEPLRTL